MTAKPRSAKRPAQKPKRKAGRKRPDFLDLPADARRVVWETISDDLPDGAALAMAEEFGLQPEDLCE